MKLVFFPTAVFLYKLDVPWKTNWNFCFVLSTPVFIHLVNQAETCFSVTYKNKAFHFWPLTFALAIQECWPVIHKIHLSWISKSTKISNIPIYFTFMEPVMKTWKHTFLPLTYKLLFQIWILISYLQKHRGGGHIMSVGMKALKYASKSMSIYHYINGTTSLGHKQLFIEDMHNKN